MMSEKRYQISPIELVQWAEPLFGFGEGKATGFSEKTIAAYETAAGIPCASAIITANCHRNVTSRSFFLNHIPRRYT